MGMGLRVPCTNVCCWGGPATRRNCVLGGRLPPHFRSWSLDGDLVSAPVREAHLALLIRILGFMSFLIRLFCFSLLLELHTKLRSRFGDAVKAKSVRCVPIDFNGHGRTLPSQPHHLWGLQRRQWSMSRSAYIDEYRSAVRRTPFTLMNLYMFRGLVCAPRLPTV